MAETQTNCKSKPLKAEAGVQLSACHPLQVSAIGHTVNQSLTSDNSGPKDEVTNEPVKQIISEKNIFLGLPFHCSNNHQLWLFG